MKVTTLTENNRLEERTDLLSEHGLSLHIRYGDRQILFDTGISDAFAKNAEKLGVDLGEVDTVVISHHHYDHGGGLSHFLAANSSAKVHLRRWDGGECWFKGLLIVKRFVGLDRELFGRFPGRFEMADRETVIAPGIHLLTEIELPHPVPVGNRKLFTVKDGVWRRDPFDHELILVIEEGNGLVVFSGCSHRGILNILDAVVRRFPGNPIKAVLGGFHLIATPVLNTMAGGRRGIERLGHALAEYPVERYYTGHCTGLKAFRILKRVMGERIQYLPTGSRVEI